MAYLDNSTITVDAILTKKGRELFAKSSNKFVITKFALSDDEVDYRLYDKTHPSGSAYYADAIEGVPILEALPDETKMLKYKLVSLPKNTTAGYVVTVGQTSYTSMWMPETYSVSRDNVPNTQPASEAVISPQTSAGGDATLGYTAVLYDSTYLSLTTVTGVSGNPSIPVTGNTYTSSPLSVTKVGKSFKITAKALPSGVNTSGNITLRITGNETGQSVTITVVVKRRSVYDPDTSTIE